MQLTPLRGATKLHIVNATGLKTALWRCDLGADLPLLAGSGRWVRVTTFNTQHDPWWSFMPHTKLRGINVEEPFCRNSLRSLWRLACGDRATPGSRHSSRRQQALHPTHDPTHTDRWTAPRPRRAALVIDWHRPSAPGRWTVRRRLLNPVSSLASVGKQDR